MDKVRILHNPESGDSLFSKEDLTSFCEAHQLRWSYYSLKKENWDNFDDEPDLLLICGGDGSVRKVLEALQAQHRNYPMALIPAGTANNFSKSIPVKPISKSMLISKQYSQIDLGKIRGASSETFFMESFGIGLLPLLIEKMSHHNTDGKKATDNIKASLEELLALVKESPGISCTIRANGICYEGTYLLVETMNIPYAGPNLRLAFDCSPLDGKLNLVMVPVEERADFESFVLDHLHGNDSPYRLTSIMADSFDIQWEKGPTHADDEIMESSGSRQVQINIVKQMFPVFVAKT